MNENSINMIRVISSGKIKVGRSRYEDFEVFLFCFDHCRLCLNISMNLYTYERKRKK